MSEKLISADAIVQKIEKEIKDIVIAKCPYADRKKSEYEIGFNNGLTLAKAIVMNAPAVDAVEVVRCGKCVYYRQPRAKIFQGCCENHDGFDGYVDDNEFCVYGKRGEDGREGE